MRIQSREQLARSDGVAGPNKAFGHSTADAERQSHLVFRLNVAGELDDFAELALLDDKGANRARIARLLARVAAAAREHKEKR